MRKTLRVGVLFGGQSAEHEVSLMSASAVLQALAEGPYELVPIAIGKDGRWLVGKEGAALLPAAIPLTDHARRPLPAEADAGEAVEPFRPDQVQSLADVIFPVLHGPRGEDGTVQGLLELAGVPYVGSGVLGSSLAMDKIAMKAVLGAHSVPQVAYRAVTRHAWESRPDEVIRDLEKALAYPLFVKPANLGSSIGISRVQGRDGLGPALDLAATHDRRIIVEEGVSAREFEVGILGLDEPEASVVGEVEVHDHTFYDYEAKYVDGSTTLVIPARIPPEIGERMRALAITAFQALDCAGLARVDFFWDRRDRTVYLNEVNTLPGFTPYSMYPVLWQATGVSYRDLLVRLIDLALERHRRRGPGGDA